MDASSFYNLIGISILISGALIAAYGFFFEKDKDIMVRTTPQFGNEEHFRSMLNQKYSEIIGFFLIIIGSIIQFIITYLDLNCQVAISKGHALIAIIIVAVVFNIALINIIKQVVVWQDDKISIKGWISNYEELFAKKDKQEHLKKSCDHSLEQIKMIINRRYPKFDYTTPDKLIEFAKKKFK